MGKYYSEEDIKRLEKEYNNASTRCAEEYILLMIKQVKMEIKNQKHKVLTKEMYKDYVNGKKF